MRINGFNIETVDKKEAIEHIFQQNKIHVISGNPEVLYNLDKIKMQGVDVTKNAYIIPDGVGVLLAGRLVGRKDIPDKLAGIDLFDGLLSESNACGKRIFILGAKHETLLMAIKNIREKYPNINIVGHRDGFFEDENAVIDEIVSVKPDILFVAMGCPKQELLIIKAMEHLDTQIFMGVGGAIDVFSGNISRAPKRIVNMKLEWLWRVTKEPFRLYRLRTIPLFLWKVCWNEYVMRK